MSFILTKLLSLVRAKAKEAPASQESLELKLGAMTQTLSVATFNLSNKPIVTDKVDILCRGSLGEVFAKTGRLDVSALPENKYLLFACAKPRRSEAMPFFGGHLLLRKRTSGDRTTITIKVLNIAHIKTNGLFKMFVQYHNMTLITKGSGDQGNDCINTLN